MIPLEARHGQVAESPPVRRRRSARGAYRRSRLCRRLCTDFRRVHGSRVPLTLGCLAIQAGTPGHRRPPVAPLPIPRGRRHAIRTATSPDPPCPGHLERHWAAAREGRRPFFLTLGKAPPTCPVFNLVVDRDAQGRGIGRRLITTPKDAARRPGCGRIHGDVYAENPRWRSWNASGCVCQARRSCYACARHSGVGAHCDMIACPGAGKVSTSG